MRRQLLETLICPNTHKPGFTAFAATVRRRGQTIVDFGSDDLAPKDDIIDGLVVDTDRQYAYPVRCGVLSMLRDEDVDLREFLEHLRALRDRLAPEYLKIAEDTADRLKERRATDDGNWNREEMHYYDKAVDTVEKRRVMCEDIAKTYLPHIFLPRQKHVIAPLLPTIANKTVIEIGCGNARTITRLMPPDEHKYRYIGSDISFWRLVVAKSACPEGEFIQANAFNLPLASECGNVGISFGMLHHLPRPIEGLRSLHRTLKSGACLAIHEPIVARKIIEGRFCKLELILQDYEHSEHDAEVDFGQFSGALDEMGYTVRHQEFLASPFRTLIESVTNRINRRILKSTTVYRALLAADRLCIHSICRLSELLAPRGVITFAVQQ